MEVSLEVEALEDELAGMDPADQVLHVDPGWPRPRRGGDGGSVCQGFRCSCAHSSTRLDARRSIRSCGATSGSSRFRSLTTEEFEVYLDAELLSAHPQARQSVPVKQWLYEPGLPANRHVPVSAALDVAEEAARGWADGSLAAGELDTEGWTTQHWQQFVRAMPENLESERLAELDSAFGFTDVGNAEILTDWLKLAVSNRYAPADGALEEFLVIRWPPQVPAAAVRGAHDDRGGQDAGGRDLREGPIRLPPSGDPDIRRHRRLDPASRRVTLDRPGSGLECHRVGVSAGFVDRAHLVVHPSGMPPRGCPVLERERRERGLRTKRHALDAFVASEDFVADDGVLGGKG